MDSNHSAWDSYSEQPYPIRHRLGKVARLRYAFADYVKSILTTVVCLPFVLSYQTALSSGYRSSSWSRPQRRSDEFIGLAVGLQSCDGPRQAAEIRELGVKHILLRIPVWEIDQLDKYVDFMDSLPECEFIACIMQDREHVLDAELWRTNLRTIVSRCWPRVSHYQIGQGINRSKWGFLTTGEFLSFASVAEELRDNYPGINLVGPCVLDFETIPLLRSLVHGHAISWDVVGCALYVDRRGSPRNRQMLLFDLKQKIYHFAACIRCSAKAKRRFWITEVNWPLKNQGRYAPTGEAECVSEEDAARYLVEYYEDAWKSQLVERVYWWQLVAKGFGLMDVDADGSLRHRPAYHAFKELLQRRLPDLASDAREKVETADRPFADAAAKLAAESD